MTDKEYGKQKKRISGLFNKWLKLLNFRGWLVTVEYVREQQPEPNTDYAPKSIGGRWAAALTTTCDPYYLTAQIRAYLLQTRDVEDDDLEEYFVHELMHILLSLMHSKRMAKEEEQVATKLAQEFIALHKRKNG